MDGSILKCQLCHEICKKGAHMKCCGARACRACAFKKITSSRTCWSCSKTGLTTTQDLVNDDVLRKAVEYFNDHKILLPGCVKELTKKNKGTVKKKLTDREKTELEEKLKVDQLKEVSKNKGIVKRELTGREKIELAEKLKVDHMKELTKEEQTELDQKLRKSKPYGLCNRHEKAARDDLAKEQKMKAEEAPRVDLPQLYYHCSGTAKDQIMNKRKYTNYKQVEVENRVEGLSKTLDASNKGFAMLAKMGYQPGDRLGKKETGILEPVGIKVKTGRSGLGLGTEKMERRKFQPSSNEKPAIAFQNCLREGSILEVQKINKTKSKYYCLHCKGGFFYSYKRHFLKGGHFNHMKHCKDVQSCLQVENLEKVLEDLHKKFEIAIAGVATKKAINRELKLMNREMVSNKEVQAIRDQQFITGLEIREWAIVCFAPSTTVPEHNLKNFTEQLQETSNDRGMPIIGQPCIKYAVEERELDQDLVEPMFRNLKSIFCGLQLIVVVIPDSNPIVDIYSEVKRVGDTVLGIATQCVKVKNVKNPHHRAFPNLCLKINAKLGLVDGSPDPSENKMGSQPEDRLGGNATEMFDPNGIQVLKDQIITNNKKDPELKEEIKLEKYSDKIIAANIKKDTELKLEKGSEQIIPNIKKDPEPIGQVWNIKKETDNIINQTTHPELTKHIQPSDEGNTYVGKVIQIVDKNYGISAVKRIDGGGQVFQCLFDLCDLLVDGKYCDSNNSLGEVIEVGNFIKICGVYIDIEETYNLERSILVMATSVIYAKTGQKLLKLESPQSIKTKEISYEKIENFEKVRKVLNKLAVSQMENALINSVKNSTS